MNESTEHIRHLLNLYYSGESTEAQQARLREYLAQAELPDEFVADAELFRAMSTPPELPAGARRRINAALAAAMAAESRVKSRPWVRMAGIAAGLALLIAAGVGLLHPGPSPRELTEEEACRQVEMAFTMLTSTIKKGCESINSL